MNSQKSNSSMFNENREMMYFLDKYFDIFKIDVDFYPHNLEQIKDNMPALKHINFKLRNFFENNGLYSWEVDSYIINGSEPIRLSMTSKIKVDVGCMCDCICY